MLSGDYPVFGWERIRLVPAAPGSGSEQPLHHGAARGRRVHRPPHHRLAGITLPSTATGGGRERRPAADRRHDVRRRPRVQWGSYELDVSQRRGSRPRDGRPHWAQPGGGHKPFVMQDLPPIVTMRVDDGKGPFD